MEFRVGDLILVENFDDVKIRDLGLVVEKDDVSKTVKVFDTKRLSLDVWGRETLSNYIRSTFPRETE